MKKYEVEFVDEEATKEELEGIERVFRSEEYAEKRAEVRKKLQKKMGRPAKEPSEVRNKKIQFLVTEEEYNNVQSKAKAADKTLSSFAHDAVVAA